MVKWGARRRHSRSEPEGWQRAMPCALGVTRSEPAGSLTSCLSRRRLGHERVLVLERSTGETVRAGALHRVAAAPLRGRPAERSLDAATVGRLTRRALACFSRPTYRGGAMSTPGNTGPLGRPRGVGFGGVLGLVIWIVLHPVMAFVIRSEIGKMYKKDGQEPPMSGWTGLWLFPFGFLIVPAIVWFVKIQGALNSYWEARVPVAAGGASPA